MQDLRLMILGLLKQEFGEYSHFEVKQLVAWDTPEKKTEFIRDIQSLCNSLTDESHRYLVIGYNKYKKQFEDVANFSDFDDGKLVSLLSAYFDPEITFKSYGFKTDDGKNFVVLEFPTKDLTPPHIIKREITQQGKDPFLSLGEIWIKGGGKGGSSAKRRATRDDLYSMFDLYIERNSEKRAQIRVDEILKTKQSKAIAQELAQPENFDLSLIYKEDQVFINVIKQLILGEKSMYLREFSEALRQSLFTSWKELKPNQNDTPGDIQKLSEDIYNTKTNQIIPTIRKLTILGMLLIRVRGYPSIFESLINTLSEFYHLGYDTQYGVNGIQNINHPNDNLSHNVPTIESMSAFNLIGAYAVKMNNSNYVSKLINLTSNWEDGHAKRFMIFLFLGGKQEERRISELIDVDGKSLKNFINYYTEKGSYLIPHFFDDSEDLLNSLSGFDFVKELNSQALIHSWIAEKEVRSKKYQAEAKQFPDGTPDYKLRELEDEILGEYNYWRSPFAYFPSCIGQEFDRIGIVFDRFIALYKENNFDELKNYFVKDKHNNIDFNKFDKFLFDSFEDIKRQRAQSHTFLMSWGWVGANVESFMKETAIKYNKV